MQNRIIIWDDNAQRLNAMEPNLRVALTQTGVKASIQTNCEPPLLSRHNLTGNTPAIQVNDGDFWRHTIGETVTVDQFVALLRKLKHMGLLSC